MMTHRAYWSVLFTALVAPVACAEVPSDSEPIVANGSSELHAASREGAVFSMSNASDGNRVLAFRRLTDGSLEPAGDYATEGMGSGASLGSQGSVTLSEDGRFLLVVNAKSNDVSSFAVHGTRLSLRSRVASGGLMPTSVAERHRLVYALNAGDNSNISGFWLDPSGVLRPIPNSTRALSAAMPSAAEVAIAPKGLGVVVTEKGTNLIDVFSLRFDGSLGSASTHASAGAVPYGFDFSPMGTLVVSEASPGAVSSYALGRMDKFSTVSASVSDLQKAPCWVVVTKDGQFAYTANAGSSSISGYAIGADASLRLLDSSGVTAALGQGGKPLDMALDRAGHLYVVDGGNRAIDGFTIGTTGSLTPVSSAGGLPSTVFGIAAL